MRVAPCRLSDARTGGFAVTALTVVVPTGSVSTLVGNQPEEVDMPDRYIADADAAATRSAARDTQIRALIALHGDVDTDIDTVDAYLDDDLPGGGGWSEDQRNAA
jgi:hypothetical protein